MFGGLFGSIWHRIKWAGIFLLVIFGALAITNPSAIGPTASTLGNVAGQAVGGIATVVTDVFQAIQSNLPHH